jgi:hypothetical protein
MLKSSKTSHRLVTNAGRNAKGTPPSPPLCPCPPVDARPPSARLRPLPLPPFCARHLRPLPLQGMRKGRGGAGREKYAPFALALPCCCAECTPSPPGSPHVQRGSAPLCTCGEVRGGGGALPSPFRTHPASVGHAKGESGTQARNVRQHTKGTPPPLCPRPPPLPRGPPVHALTPRLATRAEREHPCFAHAVKWGALPFPPPPFRAHPTSAGHAKGRGGGARKRYAPPSARLSPPVRHTCKEGRIPSLHAWRTGGLSPRAPFAPCLCTQGMQKGATTPPHPCLCAKTVGVSTCPLPPTTGRGLRE